MSAPTALEARSRPTPRRAGGLLAARRQEAAIGYLFIAPLLAIFAAFVLYPLALAVQFAFSRYQFLTGELPASPAWPTSSAGCPTSG